MAMKVALVLALVLLVMLAGLPVAMGQVSHLGDCPACTSPNGPLVLGLCAAVLAIVAFTATMRSHPIGLRDRLTRNFLLTSSIFRPPRLG
jgi:hypothetical protein